MNIFYRNILLAICCFTRFLLNVDCDVVAKRNEGMARRNIFAAKPSSFLYRLSQHSRRGKDLQLFLATIFNDYQLHENFWKIKTLAYDLLSKKVMKKYGFDQEIVTEKTFYDWGTDFLRDYHDAMGKACSDIAQYAKAKEGKYVSTDFTGPTNNFRSEKCQLSFLSSANIKKHLNIYLTMAFKLDTAPSFFLAINDNKADRIFVDFFRSSHWDPRFPDIPEPSSEIGFLNSLKLEIEIARMSEVSKKVNIEAFQTQVYLYNTIENLAAVKVEYDKHYRKIATKSHVDKYNIENGAEAFQTLLRQFCRAIGHFLDGAIRKSEIKIRSEVNIGDNDDWLAYARCSIDFHHENVGLVELEILAFVESIDVPVRKFFIASPTYNNEDYVISEMIIWHPSSDSMTFVKYVYPLIQLGFLNELRKDALENSLGNLKKFGQNDALRQFDSFDNRKTIRDRVAELMDYEEPEQIITTSAYGSIPECQDWYSSEIEKTCQLIATYVNARSGEVIADEKREDRRRNFELFASALIRDACVLTFDNEQTLLVYLTMVRREESPQRSFVVHNQVDNKPDIVDYIHTNGYGVLIADPRQIPYPLRDLGIIKPALLTAECQGVFFSQNQTVTGDLEPSKVKKPRKSTTTEFSSYQYPNVKGFANSLSPIEEELAN